MLAQAGADIKQLNTVRIALSRLKGGKLARKAAPAKVSSMTCCQRQVEHSLLSYQIQCISLIMSDIVGDPIDLVSSGPTVLQRTGRCSPLEVLREQQLMEKAPRKVLDLLTTQDSEAEKDGAGGQYYQCGPERDLSGRERWPRLLHGPCVAVTRNGLRHGGQGRTPPLPAMPKPAMA